MAEHRTSPPDAAPPSPSDHSRRQLEALLEVSEAIAQQRELPALFHDLVARLHSVVDFDFLTLVLHDPVRNVMRLHILETEIAGEKPVGGEKAIDEHPAGIVWQTQVPFVVADIESESRYPEFLDRLREHHVRSLALIPLTTAQRRLGALGFGRVRAHAITPSELQFMRRVASQIAVAVDNALNFESAGAYQAQLARERDRLRVLLDVNNVLISSRDLPDLFSGIVASVRRVIQHDFTSLALLDAQTGLLKIHALDFPGRQGLIKQEVTVPAGSSPSGQAISSGQPLIARGDELGHYSSEVIRFLRNEKMQSVCCVPLITHGQAFGSLNLASRRPDAFPPADVELLQQVCGQIAIAVQNTLTFKEIEALKNKLAEEKLYLEEEIRTEFNFEEIVGESSALKRALSEVQLAAPADTTVLLLGESGTGKELFARAIHNLSPRRNRTFVKVNCAAIPSGLLESELFGHERGAFTGAVSQKIGRFELADRGSLFLDEVGDLPLELQPKLLRILQEQEFERLGSTRTQRVDVRVVAATNSDLSARVAARAFRSDLYYRLNVFPIHIPALRERAEDIPLLVRYFVQEFSRRLGRQVEYIPAEAMDALSSYAWPGNVRELENLIERAVLLSPGKELRVPISELKSSPLPSPAGADSRFSAGPDGLLSPGISTLEAAEREHILRALRQTRWRIAGPKGAAGILGLKRTTLQARMRKLGIRRPV